MANQRLQALHDAGVSIWLDDLSRQRIQSGELARLITDSCVTGVTTNPTIFAAAFADMSLYGAQLDGVRGRPVDEITRVLMAADVTAACRVFAPVFEATNGVDGRVSIEVEPGLAHDEAGTIAQAAQLHAMVGEPNVLIKIPATLQGLGAIRATIAAGISVNVTLIFSLERYRAVMDAYMAGLEDALAAGHDISGIHSVASFFVSRVDTEVDKRLTAIGTAAARQLMGKAAVANARAAFGEYQQAHASPRFQALQQHGANVQRPLWASTGTKNPAYPDTIYVADLIARPCVNTMPEKTLDAFADHGVVPGDTISEFIGEANNTLAALANIGVDYADVTAWLESDGVAKFVASWNELIDAVQTASLRN
ncbi:MAG: transaldolase [Propionibacteriaceae bacterium]|nr:transaldolase [Propionibacteriaceae bacterium]